VVQSAGWITKTILVLASPLSSLATSLVRCLWILVFGVFGAIAAIVAPPRRRLRFFLLTLVFLGH
jgi:hypothetical protein